MSTRGRWTDAKATTTYVYDNRVPPASDLAISHPLTHLCSVIGLFYPASAATAVVSAIDDDSSVATILAAHHLDAPFVTAYLTAPSRGDLVGCIARKLFSSLHQ
jgi:hypothetical protein